MKKRLSNLVKITDLEITQPNRPSFKACPTPFLWNEEVGIELHLPLLRQTPSLMAARSSRQLPPTDHTDLRKCLSHSPGKGHQSSPNPSPSLDHTGKHLITTWGLLLLPESPEKSWRLQFRKREAFRHLLKQICPECEMAVLILPMICCKGWWVNGRRYHPPKSWPENQSVSLSYCSLYLSLCLFTRKPVPGSLLCSWRWLLTPSTCLMLG